MPDYPPCAQCGLGWPDPNRPFSSFAEVIDRLTGARTPLHNLCVEPWQVAHNKRYSAQRKGEGKSVTSTAKPYKGSGKR